MIRQSITVNDQGLLNRLADYPDIIEQESQNFLEIVVNYLLRLVRSYTPIGTTGRLHGSIFSEIQGQGINLTGIIDSSSPYAEAVEKGTKNHWVPIEPLKLWAMRTHGDEQVAYAIRHQIAKKGTKGHFMFKRAFEQAKSFVVRQQQALGEKIRHRIEGDG